MARKPAGHVPQYRYHKPRDAACVDLFDASTGRKRRVYLGKYDTPESRREYLRVLQEWEDGGRVLDGVSKPEKTHTAAAPGETVGALLLAYWQHWKAKRGVTGDGDMGGRDFAQRSALRVCRRVAGADGVEAFGPLRLQEVREAMIAEGWARRTVNDAVRAVVSAFEWGVAQERVPPDRLVALRSIKGLRRGEQGVKSETVRTAVPLATVEATRPELSPVVRAVVDLLLYTGARTGEITAMRPIDLDTTGTVWTFTPEHHKGEWRGHERTIYLGPKSQEVVKPYLNRPVDAFMFSPAESVAQGHAAKREGRTSHPSVNRSRDERRAASTGRRDGERYNADTLRRAIGRACDRAGVDRWTPHQLRHLAATMLRKEHGLEIASLVLGHGSATLTDAVYAARDADAIKDVIARVG